MSELINPVTEDWDTDLVNELFTEEDARIILSIPVKPDMEDFPTWHYDKRGNFSVKSAYQLGVSIKESEGQRDAEPSSGQGRVMANWQHIWKLNLPGNVRMFLWRLAHNSLPTRVNIRRKHAELDTLCPMCSRLDEDGGHLFLKCKLVKAVWREQNLEEFAAWCFSGPAWNV
ncbi:NAC domain-containing protein 78 [Hordeum vulgare]|nr:NAC domain-containing protein 78 [Hordeum vulgare]